MPEAMRGVSEESLRLGYESTDANAKGIFITGILGLLIGIVIFLGIWWLFNHDKREVRASQKAPSGIARINRLPPEPRLQLNPQEELKAYIREKQDLLHASGWTDRENGWVHIPIEDAMRLLVQEQSESQGKKR